MKPTTFAPKGLDRWMTSFLALALTSGISFAKPALATPSSPTLSADTASTVTSQSESSTIAQLTNAASPIYGAWTLRYSVDGIVHESRLAMQGHSGMMRTRFFNANTGRTEVVDQTMKLRSSSQGLVLLGYNPVYAGTNTRNTTYSPDNFLFQVRPNGSAIIFTCDDAGRCSPVEIE